MKFVQAQILTEKSLRNRAKRMKSFLRIGDQLREVGNYQSLSAIFGALNSTPVQRLKDAWKRVPEKWLVRYKQWKDVFNQAKDFSFHNIASMIHNSLI